MAFETPKIEPEDSLIPAKKLRFSLAITGASGVRYGLRLLQVLTRGGHSIDLMISKSAVKCLELECSLSANPADLFAKLEISSHQVRIHDCDNIASALASGSSLRDLYAGFIMPCSMGTAARIAYGHSGNLIERHADVLIKEKKPLVIVPRETPFSAIHLENLLRLVRLGCHIVPAMPGFYHDPKTVNDLVDHVVGKAMDVVGLDHHLFQRWQGETLQG